MSAPLLCFTTELNRVMKVLFKLSKPWRNTNTRHTIVANVYFASIQDQAAKGVEATLLHVDLEHLELLEVGLNDVPQ